MSGLFFLGLAVALSLIGLLVIWLRHRPPRSVDAQVRAFARQLEALAPEPGTTVPLQQEGRPEHEGRRQHEGDRQHEGRRRHDARLEQDGRPRREGRREQDGQASGGADSAAGQDVKRDPPRRGRGPG